MIDRYPYNIKYDWINDTHQDGHHCEKCGSLFLGNRKRKVCRVCGVENPNFFILFLAFLRFKINDLRKRMKKK